MATIVCHQGLMVEPRALRLTLSSMRPLESAGKSCSVKPETGGWSFVEALFNSPKLSNEIEGNENIYVHPLEKRSLSSLSEKSLELCTENLGSETGSDDIILEDDIFSLSSSSSSSQTENPPPTWKQNKSRDEKEIGGDFPPPLTTISGSESIRVRSHRENGRLVIKAEKAPSRNPVFRAERSNGRLRLCLLEYSTSSIDYEEDETADYENENNKEEEEEEEFENDDIYIAKEEGGGGERGETTTFQRGRCKEGENENQMGGFLSGYYNIHSLILDLPV